MERLSAQHEEPLEFKNATETRRALLLAEEIGLARMELEEKLLAQTGAPISSWDDIAERVLAAHPALESYKTFFLQAVAAAKIDFFRVKDAWCKARKENPNEIEDPLGEGKAGVIAADEKTSQALFLTIFDREPAGPIQAERYRTAILFAMSPEDFAWVSKIDPDVVQQSEIGGLYLKAGGVPIIAENRETIVDDQERATSRYHELEHRKNDLLRRSRGTVLHPELYIRIEPGLWNKLRQRESRELPIEENAKDELLAQLTVALYYPSLTQLRRLNVRDDETLKDVEAFVQSFDEALEKEMTSGGYAALYAGAKELSAEDQRRYQKSVQGGIAAFRRLRERYAQTMDAPSDGRLALNVLEQFPLHLWPAVERLAQMQKRSEKT